MGLRRALWTMPNPAGPRLAEALFQVHSSLAEEFTKVLANHFNGLETHLAEELRRDRESQAAAAAGAMSRRADELRQQIRRIGRSGSLTEWSAAVLDAAASEDVPCALFAVGGSSIRCMGARNAIAPAPPDLSVPLSEAPAFAGVLASGDAVVTVAEPGELSPGISALFRSGGGERAHLFPVLARRGCVAILCAQPAAGAGAFLEPIALVAGLAYPEPAPPAPLVTIAVEGAGRERPAGRVELPEPEGERHRNAQRFSRVQVAGIRLHRAAAVRSGRAAGDLYAALKQEIDTSREAYRRQFLADSPTMVDYFHQELVRTLANGQDSLLGPGYPGPLV